MTLIDPSLRDIWLIFFFYELWIFYSLDNLSETHLKPMTSEKIDLTKGVVGKTNCHEKQLNELTFGRMDLTSKFYNTASTGAGLEKVSHERTGKGESHRREGVAGDGP